MRLLSTRTARALALVLVATPLLIAACADQPPPHVPPPTSTTPPPVAVETPAPPPPVEARLGIDKSALDPNTAPCDDFYQYACGGWLKATEIPEDQARWSRSFDVLFEKNEMKLREILEHDAAGNNVTDAYGKQLGDFYASCMDEGAAEKQGAGALKGELAKIDAIKSPKEFAAEIAHLHAIGVGAVFNFDSTQDFKDATQVIGDAEQGGLGLPDRDYYTQNDAKMTKLRAAYVEHVEKSLALIDDKNAKADADAIMKLETDLAKASMNRTDRRDPKKVYHRLERKGLQTIAPLFDWDGYLSAIGATDVNAINVEQPEFMKEVNKLLANLPHKSWSTWQAYLKWHLVRSFAPRLSKAFVDEDFAFKHELTGAAKILPRWKRCERAVDQAMGEALARPFVKETLGAEGKQEAKDLITTIESAMHDDLEALTWMDATTRERALTKLSKVSNKIGYPDKWRNYDSLNVDRASYAENVMRANAFETKRRLDKIGKPLDRGEWQMTPPTVNAYYDGSLNEMVFPAGILQVPFYSPRMLPAVAYGAIGLVMGHELTHGFDDQGRKFDGNGNLSDWWTAPVGKDFERRAACVASQFDDYTVLGDLHIKGKLTLGENIADLGGMKLAHAALAKKGLPNVPDESGFTPDQEFFIGFAQGWCTKMRDEAMRLQVQTNTHSPSQFRVNGPASNLSSFAEAFKCGEGSKMVRPKDKRCEIW